LRGKFGVFATAEEACAAAQEAFLQLQQKGMAARRKIEEIVKAMAEKNAEPWGKIEFEETKIGSLAAQDRQARIDQARARCGLVATGRDAAATTASRWRNTHRSASSARSRPARTRFPR
jgi:hypothetical protein